MQVVGRRVKFFLFASLAIAKLAGARTFRVATATICRRWQRRSVGAIDAFQFVDGEIAHLTNQRGRDVSHFTQNTLRCRSTTGVVERYEINKGSLCGGSIQRPVGALCRR
jgi:hypothetical protein